MITKNQETPRQAIFSRDEIRQRAEGFSVNSLLKHHAYRNRPLDFETAYLLGVFALSPYHESLRGIFDIDPSIVEKQSIAVLCALHNRATYERKDAAQQIAGIVAAVFDYDVALSSKGFVKPSVPFVMDNCGMGGDLYRTPNVSTIAALIAASDGIPMCKHGSPGNTDSTGSSDFLEFCGMNLRAECDIVEQAVEQFKFSYTDALDTGYKSVHVQTHKSARLAHMNDIIGPMTNPVDPTLMTCRVLGVNHLLDPRMVAEAYHILNLRGMTNVEHALFVRGFVEADRNGGIDEVSVFAGGTAVAELNNGAIKTYDLAPEDFGIPAHTYFKVPEGRLEKARFSRRILEGVIDGAPRDLILANAAILMYLARDIPLKEGYLRADELLASGAPLRNLEACVEFTRRTTP
ncbi:MAG TPA: hypothetical protein VJH22_03230 [Candidatus Nanoarchaeia archaeon]|nr:hypothetical protein [Candidatus Nanoarchaeia archaeon]